MKKYFLVTGGTGFIGSNVVNMLLEKGHKVTVFDNNIRGKINRINYDKKNLKIVIGDIRNKKQLNRAFKGINSIIHLAYINGTKYFYSKPELVLDVGIKGLVNVFDLAIENKVKEIFLASSSEVYHHPKVIPTKEEESIKIPDIFNARYSYAGGKILTELYGINFGKKFFKRMIIFRPHNVYGNDMGNEHVIPEFISRFRKTKNNSSFKIQGTGKEKRSFIHIKDFCEALNLIIEKGKNLSVYNIGTKELVNINTLVKILEKVFFKKVKIVKSRLKKGGTPIRCPDISKIKKIGFKQKIKLFDGIKSIIYRKI